MASGAGGAGPGVARVGNAVTEQQERDLRAQRGAQVADLAPEGGRPAARDASVHPRQDTRGGLAQCVLDPANGGAAGGRAIEVTEPYGERIPAVRCFASRAERMPSASTQRLARPQRPGSASPTTEDQRQAPSAAGAARLTVLAAGPVGGASPRVSGQAGAARLMLLALAGCSANPPARRNDRAGHDDACCSHHDVLAESSDRHRSNLLDARAP
jgi:hypothetical protein